MTYTSNHLNLLISSSSSNIKILLLSMLNLKGTLISSYQLALLDLIQFLKSSISTHYNRVLNPLKL